MSIPEWPKQLPCALQQDYKLKKISGVKRTKMESGRSRVRRQFVSTPSIASVTWYMNSFQAEIFEGWVNDTAEGGAAWVKIPIRTPMDGRATSLYTCRFTDIYDGPKLVGPDTWEFTAELELKREATLQGDWSILPGFLTGKDIFDIAMNDRWPAS